MPSETALPGQKASGAPTETPLRLVGIHKNFGGVVAIKTFDLDVQAGEIVALVGDNGAGKSTLIKIISGLYQPSDGEIWLDGRPANFRDASDARAKGVEVVYQDLALVVDQPVYMNMFLGRELTTGPFKILDRKRMATETQKLVDSLDVRIPSAKATLSDLSGGQRQGVAICRATHWASSLVLLDEPTAALGVAETAKVEELILKLKARGAAILIVSHNMDQVFRIADRVSVLRRGTQVGTRVLADTTHNELVAMITGLTS
ncbi:ATP-binding cassette domain-containing protein [Herbiconiux sp. CPCC 203407]|uniref:ATP-binding cassette domain-containing protein n=1 Tax=Herbiconiux oxytropis TaxID=2970915 RepID=A0AA41XAZ9_9MICO|nr:ATP-binding cassette domain-containing protein [Herbiconiux oxytropis]MCS5720759.1 ATP-binding cassette domain-containing protein [Herbiconiux oxytropis]MCS5724914.1 ATP-binding cassette domain-containing protein [Herbiconiux oxytropis]